MQCAHPPSTLRLEPYAEQCARHWPAAGRHVLAQASGEALVVYQAYSPSIGVEAARRGHFLVPGFSMDRMTWIKPNFLWMAYRCALHSGPAVVWAAYSTPPAWGGCWRVLVCIPKPEPIAGLQERLGHQA